MSFGVSEYQSIIKKYKKNILIAILSLLCLFMAFTTVNSKMVGGGAIPTTASYLTPQNI